MDLYLPSIWEQLTSAGACLYADLGGPPRMRQLNDGLTAQLSEVVKVPAFKALKAEIDSVVGATEVAYFVYA